MVETGRADIDGDALVLQAGDRKVGILEGAPGQLQKQALLRIHEGRFTTGNAEQCGIEGMDILQYAGSISIVFASYAHFRVPESRTVPTIARNVSDGADSRTHHLEQSFRRSSPRCGACTPDYFYCHILLSQSFIGLRHDNLGASPRASKPRIGIRQAIVNRQFPTCPRVGIAAP